MSRGVADSAAGDALQRFPAIGASILDLNGTNVSRGDLQRVEGGRQIGPRDIAPGRGRADAHACAIHSNAAESGYIGNVNIIRLQRTLTRAGINVSSSGDDAGAVFGQ